MRMDSCGNGIWSVLSRRAQSSAKAEIIPLVSRPRQNTRLFYEVLYPYCFLLFPFIARRRRFAGSVAILQVVKDPQGVTAMLSPGTFGHGGAHAPQSWADPVNQTIYILMIQRRGFNNGDNSAVRKAFQPVAHAASNK